MSTRTLLVVGALTVLPAVAGAWGSPQAPLEDIVTLPIGEEDAIDIWAYTGTNFSGPESDPVNLFFRNADPRAIRQTLMALDGDRTTPLYPGGPSFPPVPPFNCTWADAMGYEQTGWAETEGWVGSEIQLACIRADAPLGDPFRVHLRLFRQGEHTVGAAHFEVLIPKTAEHQVLSWNFARDFVVFDMLRTGSTPPPSPIPPLPIVLETPGHFRTVLRPVYEGVAARPGGAGLLASLGLSPDATDAQGNVRIPLDLWVAVLSPDLVYDPLPEAIRTETEVEYDVNAPRPFCSVGDGDFVNLSGSLRFILTVRTDWAGRYIRYYRIDGELAVTPLAPVPGLPSPARIRERHAAVLSNHYGQVYELASQRLFSDPPQSLRWKLSAGVFDTFAINVQCAP